MAITTFSDTKNVNLILGGNCASTAGVADGKTQFANFFTVVAAPTPAGGQAYTSYSQTGTGRFPFGFSNSILAPSGQSTYLTGASYTSNSLYPQSPILMDILWATSVDSSGTTLSVGSGLQTINSVAWPARDNNQTSNGEGVYIAFIIASSLSNSTGTATISYTNSAGVSGRTGTTFDGFETLSSYFSIFGLQDGDLGVRSVETFQFSADHVSGTIYIYAFRPICLISAPLNVNKYNALTLGMPQIFDNSILAHITIKKATLNYSYCLYLSQG